MERQDQGDWNQLAAPAGGAAGPGRMEPAGGTSWWGGRTRSGKDPDSRVGRAEGSTGKSTGKGEGGPKERYRTVE